MVALTPAEAVTRSAVTAPTAPGRAVPQTAPAPATRPKLYVPEALLAGGVHGKLACVDCHEAAKALPHPRKPAPATCGTTCHAKPQADYLQGEHKRALAKGDPDAPTCATCHGGHDILPKADRRSRSFPLNIVRICGDCHKTHAGQAAGGTDGKTRVGNYLDSVHGGALMRGGLAVSATCASCHGSHRVLPSKDPQSPVYRTRVADTCGRCHVGLAEMYQASVHGRKLAGGDANAPNCTVCHTAHSITRTSTVDFKLDIVNECGHCHDQPPAGSSRKTSLYDTYRMSYHGQVTTLGFARAARCSDCHGAHDVQPTDDPNSRLSEANRLDTCRRCHPKASAGFIEFKAHADYRDGKRFPVLHAVWMYFVIVMSFAFGFFGLHSVLWLIRAVLERVRNGPPPKHAHGGPAIRRFSRIDRVNHGLMAGSFFGLTLTGLPLLYADRDWAQGLAGILGGVPGAGLLHRGFALVLIGNFVIHFIGLARRFRQRASIRKFLFGPTTMLPVLKDVKDCAGMFRWFFRGGRKPHFDRWTYWEKFDYMAEIGGSMIIGLSGLLLWFPEFFSRFLPGWVFNIAMIAHGYEALLAIVFIFTIHFFNANLRPDKFPVDDVIFTGLLAEEEFREERPAEYERLKASGDLESLRVPPAPRWFRPVAVGVGLLAMSVGATLAVLIILAGLEAI
ncbi:MAG TPA: hypothetical protein VM389_11495 [Phycisphaerae bacterium]|nr:hypothetical protein [Phycisphaerae bacterium]